MIRDPAAYKSILYRTTRAPKLPGIDSNLFLQLKAFAETIRIVDLIYLTTSRNSNLSAYLAADPTLSNPSPKNSLALIGTGALSPAGIANVRIVRGRVDDTETRLILRAGAIPRQHGTRVCDVCCSSSSKQRAKLSTLCSIGKFLGRSVFRLGELELCHKEIQY